MLRKAISILTLCCLLMFLIGCEAHMHKVGNGPTGSEKVAKKQWYILFGLVPLNTVDSHAMAGGATDYEIKTERSFVDWLISIPTSLVTIHPRTVSVTK
jgi:hypothetical protein